VESDQLKIQLINEDGDLNPSLNKVIQNQTVIDSSKHYNIVSIIGS